VDSLVFKAGKDLLELQESVESLDDKGKWDNVVKTDKLELMEREEQRVMVVLTEGPVALDYQENKANEDHLVCRGLKEPGAEMVLVENPEKPDPKEIREMLDQLEE